MSAPEEKKHIPIVSRFTKRFSWLLAFLLLPVSFYAIEDIRGALAWRAMKKQLAAAGHLTDYSEIISAPVPDEQNFFKAPIVQAWFPQLRMNDPEQVRFPRFPTNCPPPRNQPYSLAELKLLPKMSLPEATNQPSLEMLENWFMQWDPQLAELFEASNLPKSRLDGDITVPHSFYSSYDRRFLLLAHFLASKVKIEFLAGHSERANYDLGLLKGLLKPLDTKPELERSGMVRGQLATAYADTVHELLQQNTLRDTDLAEWTGQLQDMEVFTSCWKSLHETKRLVLQYSVEAHKEQGGFLEAIRDPVWTGQKLLSALGSAKREQSSGVEHMFEFGFAPYGWLLQNKVRVARGFLLLHPMFDPKARVFNVHARETAQKYFDMIMTGNRGAYTLFCGVFGENGVTPLFDPAYDQTRLDQALVACALERYRLRNGDYPKTLAELTPTFLDKRPHDLFTGKDFIYQSESTNSFKLYSVGYNGVDNGGKEGIKPGDKEAPDWVW